MSILQKVEQAFNQETLIGNHDFTEDDYSLMVDSVSALPEDFEQNSYKLIFATLVEIAKRWKQSDTAENDEENCGYWEYVFKILFGSDIHQQLCQRYRYVISWLGQNSNMPVVTRGHGYYATIMMHSFAPKSSIHALFDLCYNVFKKDLDFGFTQDDEWLCEIVAEQLAKVLRHGYREDKKVSIGSSAYSIKIGLRSFALNEDLSTDFISLIRSTFYQINQLFNREKVSEKTRLERYIVEWWKNKAESEKLSEESTRKKRVSTVSKQNITAKYIRNNNEVFLCLPSIRLDDDNDRLRLLVFVDENQVYADELRTKRGELVVATKQKEFELNDLLKKHDSINVRIEIFDNEVCIFDSEKSKTTSLKREFILFDDEKEIFSQINKPSNYFIYSKDVDALKSTPSNLATCGLNLYNIYPNAGESITGKTRQVLFVNKERVDRLGKAVCLIGNLADVEWLLDDISCNVYSNKIRLMIPNELNLKALELRIDRKSFKLLNLRYEQTENNCYQFELTSLGIIPEDEPIQFSVYSYEKEAALLTETIIVIGNLEIQFSNSFYYGNIERELIISTDNENKEITWTNQDSEITCPLNEGILLIRIPYFRWRINSREWHNEAINRILWYKEFLENGDLLEIDIPIENDEILLCGRADGKSIEIGRNQSGKYEIGRAVYANEGKRDISIYCCISGEKYEFFKVATKEHFVDNPLFYSKGKVGWNIEDTFIGEKNANFFLILKGDGNNIIRTKIGAKNRELPDIIEDVYKTVVKIKDQNIFSREDTYESIFEGSLIVGEPEQFRFKNKLLCIKEVSAAFSEGVNCNWIRPYPIYIICDIEYLDLSEHGEPSVFYIGKLGFVKDSKITLLNFLENEKGHRDRINPVRLELRNNNSFWLVAGYDKENNDFLGELIFDHTHRGLCNINSKDTKRFQVVNLYKFREQEDV